MIRSLGEPKSNLATSRQIGLKALMAAMFCLTGALVPALAADASAGKMLALQWCSACHLVAEDQSTAASVSLPSFFDMAKDPDWTEATLATFLADPHPKMPNMSLGNREIADLAKYISSLSPE